MTTSTRPRRRRVRGPRTWPVLTEDQARAVIAQDLRVAGGVPACWWRGDREVLAATHDRNLATQAADELARRDFGARQGYLDLVRTGATVDGPIEVVLVGWVGSERLDWRPAGPDAPYALYVCLVRPVDPDQLAAALDWENIQQDAGLLDPAARRTCRTCRMWAGPEHAASPEHRAATHRRGGDVQTAASSVPATATDLPTRRRSARAEVVG
jgi:hypothetical protein